MSKELNLVIYHVMVILKYFLVNCIVAASLDDSG